MTESLSFDPLAALYDETRGCDERMLDGALDFIRDSFPPVRYPRLFEPGVGTGRIAIPLARRGYRIHGVDISAEMLQRLRHKLRETAGELPIFVESADVTRLPYGEGSFDLCLAVHLFYFIPNWRRAIDEIIRVLRRGGPILLMNTGLGTEVPSLNGRYLSLCAQMGHEHRNAGVATTAQVVRYLAQLGYTSSRISDRWKWERAISVETALDYISRRAYSFTVTTPAAIHEAVVSEMRAELAAAPGGLSREMSVPSEIRLDILRNEPDGSRVARGGS